MTPQERLEDHVERLNDGARTGRFDAFSKLFADDGTLKLLGTGRGPATRAEGPDDIAATCAEVFDGRPMRVVTVIAASTESATFDYAWTTAPKEVAGQMIMKWAGDRVSCVTVTL